MSEAVASAALAGWFLASKRLNLGKALSLRVLDDGLPVWRWSALTWIVREPSALFRAPRQSARPGILIPLRDRARPWNSSADFRPPYDGYGFFLGVSRADFERVNGFDLRFEGWGGEDVDLAIRLERSGLRCGWPGAHASVLHLWHPPRKATAGSANRELLRETRASAAFVARRGLRELAAELGDQVTAKRAAASSSSSGPV
jgi:hypothetical protein